MAYTEKSQIKHENRHIQLVREYGFHPRTKATVEDGALLPRKYEPFPQNMYGRPLEEIDTFIYEEVSGFYVRYSFCFQTISKLHNIMHNGNVCVDMIFQLFCT